MLRLGFPRAGNCLPLLGFIVGGAVGTRITFKTCMGPLKQPPFSGESSVLYYETFYIIKRVSDTNENFGNVSPFLVEKVITGSVCNVSSTKLLRSGDLLVEIASCKQAQQILTVNSLSKIPIAAKPHDTFKTSKGVITCGGLLNLSNDELTHELSGQGVKDVRRSTFVVMVFQGFKSQRFGHSKTNCRGTLTCARCAVAGHESTGCTAVEKCVNCQGKHTSFTRSCPKWKVEKEIVATKFKNNISFPEARRIVKAQSAPEGGSYASVVEKCHPAYQTTHCPHCNHIVTMSNPIPSTSKSPVPVVIASSHGTKNKNMLPKPSSENSAVPPDSQDSSGFTIVKRKKKPKISSKSQPTNNNQIKTNTATKFWKKSPFPSLTSASGKGKNKILKSKPDKDNIYIAKTANSTSDSSEGNSSDAESDLTVTSVPEETYLKPHDKIQIKHYNILNKIHNGDRASGGVSLLISNDVPSAPLELNSSLQAVAVRIHLHSLITVCNLYIPPNQHVAQSELNNLINQLPTPFVLIGDLNGHSPIWGSPHTNSRGLQIEKLITDFNLCLLNSDQETYFHQPTGTFHSIDMAICSHVIFPFFDLTIDNDLHNSDHFPLILNDNRYHTSISWQPPKYAFAKADWTKFALLATITSNMVQNIPIDEAIQNFTKIINDAAETSIPKKNTSRKKQSKPWWNQDSQQASKRQKRLGISFGDTLQQPT
ncbi:hypothetical protein AVEN_228337-1 [Araneus ventricosus]|uniref:Endonuclease/exonuclease/phosphatase domain-containing protein n=1 Tax=Araneus ventricosus TaxID=182803 RepID=A0A4Y2K5A2_ARAVE|nr:hypothetical protein AVEN_228337-1 [Araneus ventricosus]